MVVGFLGLTYGFLTAPATLEESKAMVAAHDARSWRQPGDTAVLLHTKLLERHQEDTHGARIRYNAAASSWRGHDAEHDEHVFHQLSKQTMGSHLCSSVLSSL